MDTTSRVVYGFFIIAITLLIITSDAFIGPFNALIASILFVLGGAFVILLLNPFAKIYIDDHDRKVYQIQREHEAQLKLRVECSQAEIATLKKQLAQECAQKRRYITLWRKAKGYDK